MTGRAGPAPTGPARPAIDHGKDTCGYCGGSGVIFSEPHRPN